MLRLEPQHHFGLCEGLVAVFNAGFFGVVVTSSRGDSGEK